jgi:hypothetical protein
MKKRFWRQVRALKLWAMISTCGLAAFGMSWLIQAQSSRTRFDEIEVERINIVEADGTLRMVLANGTRQADAVIDGRVLVTGRNRPAGMIFFDRQGNEVGGLIFGATVRGNMPAASGSLTFDQYKQDQTVALQYVEENGKRRAGLAVIDRPETSLAVVAELFGERESASTDGEREAVQRQIDALGQLSTQRMYVGKNTDGAATLVLSDGQGNQRLVLSVDESGSAKIQFLDASGTVVRELGPDA